MKLLVFSIVFIKKIGWKRRNSQKKHENTKKVNFIAFYSLTRFFAVSL